MVMMAGGAVAAAVVGGAVGFWLGKRRAARPVRPVRRFASTVDSAIGLAPVAMNLLANPLVRTMALRILVRQLSKRIER
jgi:hypothetical protein